MRDEDVYRLQKQVKRLYRRVQREQPAVEGLPMTTLQLLVALERAVHPLRPGELGAELDMASSNVAAALRVLAARELVERRPDPTDGRKASIELTGQGRRLIAEIRRDRHAWLHHAVEAELSPREQRLLLEAGDLMERLAEHAGNEE